MDIERVSTDAERVLADRLKQEAAAGRPAFSEDLHARICRAVRDEAAVYRRPRPRWAERPWTYAAIVAAACLLVAAVVAWRLEGVTAPPPIPSGGETMLAGTPDPVKDFDALTRVPGQTAEQVGLMVDAKLTTQQWTYLRDDARLATRLLIDQLPLDMLASANKP